MVLRLIPRVALPAFAQLKDVGAVTLDCIGRIALDSYVGNTYRKEWLNVDVAATRWRNTRIVVTDPHWSASWARGSAVGAVQVGRVTPEVDLRALQFFVEARGT